MTPQVLLAVVLSVVRVSAIAGGVFSVTAVHAQINNDTAPGGQGSLALSVLSDDNLTRVDSNEQSDTALLLEPSLAYLLLFGKHSAALNYQGRYASYRDFSNEDYKDHNLGIDTILDLTERLSVNAGAGAERSHDARGASGSRTTLSNEPDKWEESKIFAEMVYGRRSSSGQIALSANVAKREYTNNDLGIRDRNTNSLSATFFYNLTAKTSWLIEVRRGDIDNVSPAPINADSKENRYLLGARWQASGLSRGEIRMGYLNKEFSKELNKELDNNNAEDFSGFTLEGAVELDVRAQDNFQLTVLRSTNESAEIATNFFVSTGFGANWRHSFSDLWNASVSVDVQQDKFSGESRTDDLTAINIGTQYALTERINVSMSYKSTKRDSSATGLKYKNNTLMLTLIMQPGRHE